jgi:hypothetical protein
MKLPYGNGDLVAVPLREGGGYATGLVAAHDGGGGVIGYFFDKRFDEIPTVDETGILGRLDVLRVMRFGDLGLVEGDWVVLGEHPEWRPCDWPIPAFGRREPTVGHSGSPTRLRISEGQSARKRSISMSATVYLVIP